MATSHRTNRLKLIGTPAVEQLQNGRYQLTVNCTTMNSREDWYSANKARIFPDFGSLESAEMSIDGLAPRTGEAYTDMRLVSVQSSTQQEKYIVTLVYQTLGDSFVQVKDDTVTYTESGLRRVTRESIAKAGTDFQKTVGATSITSQIDGETAVTCILASYEVDDTDSYREVTEVYVQAGVLSRNISERNGGTGTGKLRIEVVEAFGETPVTTLTAGVKIGDEVSNVEGIPTKRFTFAKGNGEIRTSTRPGRIDGTTEVTVVSYGTEVVPSGVPIFKSETQEDGYIQFTNTCIQGTITETKQTYKDVVQVEVPGEVLCTTTNVSSGGVSGSIAIPEVTPRRRKTIAATVTVAVTTTPTNTASVAFDLGAISCSVTSTNVSLSRGPGNTVTVTGGEGNSLSETGFTQSFGASARVSTYPGCFLTSSSSSGSIDYVASQVLVASGATISVTETNSSRDTECIGTGSTSEEGYATTGIIKRNSRPILTDLNGVTYFEVITWSV